MSETPNVPKVPKEVIKKHYLAIVNSIMEVSRVTGIPVEQLVTKTVRMFGFVEVQGNSGKYEMIPELRKKCDEATSSMGAESMQQYFDEDEAILYCACQTAAMEVAGVLDQGLEAKLKAERDRAELAKAEETMSGQKGEGSAFENKSSAPNVVQFTAGKGKPTLH